MRWRCFAAHTGDGKMAGETPDLSGILSGLLQNPAALSTMAGMLGALRRPDEGSEAERPHGDGEPRPPVLSAPAEAPGHAGGRRQERQHLLAALSPFLTPQRRRALEGASKLLEVLELFEKRN